jgi:solute carrier family 6 amino acid transporter-like protein 5/7/9/14
MEFHITFTKVVISLTLLIYVLSRDSMIVTTLDMFTSVFAGLMMFSLLGNFYHKANKEDIGNIVRRGTPMAFVSFPDAVALFEDVPQVSDILYIRVR